VLLPGLPTTIFLIAASWCFARSCPWLEERLIRVPLFRPFLGYLDTSTQMPRRAVIVTLVVMWLAIALSASAVSLGDRPQPVVAAVIIGLGLVGTFFVLRLGRHRITGPARCPEAGRNAGHVTVAERDRAEHRGVSSRGGRQTVGGRAGR
jgi:uncharacterized membrane protein YbaN (DUF454 family)